MAKHTIIIVPGIPAFSTFFKILSLWLHLLGFTPIVVDLHWTDNSKNFQQKLQPLLTLIDKLSKNGNVSLIGVSAGGSAVLNAFSQRKNSIKSVVSICSRLGKINNRLNANMKKYTSFKESIELLEKNKEFISPIERRKILTIRGIFDERMPSSIAILDGANQSTTFMIFHAPIIFFTLSFLSNPLITFLRKTT